MEDRELGGVHRLRWLIADLGPRRFSNLGLQRRIGTAASRHLSPCHIACDRNIDENWNIFYFHVNVHSNEYTDTADGNDDNRNDVTAELRGKCAMGVQAILDSTNRGASTCCRTAMPSVGP
jgi:hypothetical protein